MGGLHLGDSAATDLYGSYVSLSIQITDKFCASPYGLVHMAFGQFLELPVSIQVAQNVLNFKNCL